MKYGGRTIWDKKLPAFTGIFVLLIALGLTVLLSRNAVQTVTKATVGSTPKEVKITNITATSFTVSYTTDVNAVGTIVFGKATSLGQIAIDSRDQLKGEPQEHRVHYFTVQNLEPGTRYFFNITSGAQVATNNGKPYEITTGPPISGAAPEAGTITGSVAMDDGTFPTEGVVYATAENAQTVSALIQQNGSYTIPLAQLRTNDLSTYAALQGDTKITIKVTDGSQTTDAVVLNEQASEIPQIVLSKDYNFAMSDDATSSDSAQPASQSGSFPVFDEPVAVTSPDITVPKESQQFNNDKPLFKGMALPSTPIELTIQSDKEINANLQSDEKGYWEFTPPVALGPGEHILTIASVDVNGTVQKVTRSFVVNAAGSQFTEPSVSPVEATPTQAPPVTPTIASLPSPTASATPTLEPTQILSPTIDPNFDPNASSAVTPTRGPLGATGSFATIAGIITSILFLGGGVILFFAIAV